MRRMILTVALAIAAGPSHATAQDNIAVVHRLLLDREMVIQPASGAARAAALGSTLNGSDVISTSPNTRAAVKFQDDGSLLRVNPSSEVQIRAEGAAGSVVKTIQVEFGELWARVEPQDTEYRFQVQTPAGVAAVKGTEFIVRVGEDGATTVITLEGLLDFFNGAGTVEVPVGFAATAATSAVAPSVQPVPEGLLEEFASLTTDPDAQAAEESVTIEIWGVDGQGNPMTVVLQVPRSEVGPLPGGGSGR